MLSDVNRNPRRWADGSGRVRVIEGWHPSDPSRIGYNLVVDGDWLGTFETLQDAVREAGDVLDVELHGVALVSEGDPARSDSHPTPGLHLVPPPAPEDA